MSRLPPVNGPRRRRLHARNFGAWAEQIRAMPCWYCGWRGEGVHASHTKGRQMGGCGGDRRYLLPMCWRCHRWFEGTDGPDVMRARAAALVLHARHNGLPIYEEGEAWPP